MERCKERARDVTLIDAGGNPHVAQGKLRAEGMMRPVKPPALEVVTYFGCGAQPEIELRLFVE